MKPVNQWKDEVKQPKQQAHGKSIPNHFFEITFPNIWLSSNITCRSDQDAIASDEDLELDSPFMDAGMDSLSSVALMSMVAKDTHGAGWLLDIVSMFFLKFSEIW